MLSEAAVALSVVLSVVSSSSSSDVPYTARWMEAIYGGGEGREHVKVRDVLVPGTHNSATAAMRSSNAFAIENSDYRFAKKYVYRWSKTQDRSVYQQLRDGIRYLDLRIEKSPDDGGWHTYHGLVADSVRNVMDELGRFASERPKEVVIVDLQRMVSFTEEDHQDLVDYLISHDTLGPRLAHYGLTPNVTFQQLWRRDENVIILYPVGVPSVWMWPAWIRNPWVNAQRSRILIGKLLNHIKTRPTDIFYVSQAILTPDTTTIVLGIIGTGPQSLKELSTRRINPQLEPFVQELHDEAKAAGRTANIVIADYYENGNLVGACLEANRAEVGIAEPSDAPPPPDTRASAGDGSTDSQPDTQQKALTWFMSLLGK